MNSEADNVSHYYNTSSKRSFFYSRLAIIGSMAVLLIALLLNVFFLNSQKNPQTAQSQAANDSSNTSALPSLPSGCEYQKLGHGYTVVCQNASPSVVPAPKAAFLPQQCRYEASISGNIVSCSIANQQNITIPLPELPSPCRYEPRNNGYAVICD